MRKIDIGSNFVLYDFIIGIIYKYINIFVYLFFIILSFIIIIIDTKNFHTINTIRSYTQNCFIRVVDITLYPYEIVKNNFDNFLYKVISDTLSNKYDYISDFSNVDSIIIDSLHNENDFLKKSMNFIDNYSVTNGFKYITTRANGKINNNLSHYIIIPVGTKDGVLANQAVINDKGLIGKIDKVHDNFSIVMCVTDVNFRTTAFLTNSNNNSIISGNGSDRMVLSYMKHENNEVINDEIVETLGFVENIPRGIKIGKIINNKYVYPINDCNKNNIIYVITDLIR